ncbi:MAG: M20 family metallopeptidase [Candidatus Hermodarchaeota archaeon]
MSEELILNEIEKNREEYIEFLRNLIQAESYNPPGNEKNVASIIKKYLKDANLNCEIFPFGDNRANLYCALNDKFDGKTLVYNGHMDVVPPGNEEEWKYHPLSASIKRKRVYGRGAIDMKGGLAAIVIALKLLKKLSLKLSGNLILNAVADEETGGFLGTKWLVENKLTTIECDFVIIAEPTRLEPLGMGAIVGEKARIEIKIVTNGISSHAAIPFAGKNAIIMMSEIIQNLDKIEEYIPKIEPPISLTELKENMSVAFPSKEIFEKILEEQPFLQNIIKSNLQIVKSLNMINGGIKSNVTPDLCEAIMDFRLLPNHTTDMVLEALKKVITDLGYEIRDKPSGDPEEIFVYLEVLKDSTPSYWKDWRNSEELKDLNSIVEKIYKKKTIPFFFPASADALFYRNSGYCPSTILFGPGMATNAHAADEYIEIQDFIDAIKVYSLFAAKFLR